MIDKIEEKYRENCDNKQMSIKKRGLSDENPFRTIATLAVEHEKVLLKPGQIKISEVEVDNKPLAGKYTIVGQEVVDKGIKKPYQVMTGPWNEK